MQPNLHYIKDRLLKAGALLQRGIATLEDGELYRQMHDAQNQLALALASLVQMQHAHLHENVATHASAARLLNQEAKRWTTVRPGSNTKVRFYTEDEIWCLLRARKLLLEHPPISQPPQDSQS